MKTNSDKILNYIAENMSDAEKRSFEQELGESPPLKRQYEKTLAELNRFKKAADVEVNQTYFNNLIPRVVERVEKKKKRGFVLGLSFGAVMSALVVMILFSFNGKTPDNLFNEDYNELIAETVTETGYEEVNDYLSYYDIYSYTSVDYVENHGLEDESSLDDFIEQNSTGLVEYSASSYEESEVPVIDDIIDYDNIPEESIESLYNELEKTNIL